jgi:hypothetical protein
VLQTEVLRSGDPGVYLPVNLRRLVENAQRKFGCRPYSGKPTGGRPAAAPRRLCSAAPAAPLSRAARPA